MNLFKKKKKNMEEETPKEILNELRKNLKPQFKPPVPEEKIVVEEKTIEQQIIDVLKTVYDPEIPVDIYSLGLIYEIDVSESNDVHIEMTLTSPACPVAGTLPPEIEQRVKNEVSVVNAAKVDVVWEPMWTTEMMNESAKLELGMF
jgi:FeS assembly SUF system protein